MNARFFLWLVVLLLISTAWTGPATAQGSKADYERAGTLNERFRGKVTHTKMQSVWVHEYDAFPEMSVAAIWHRTSPGGDGRWLTTDVRTGATEPAFDHDKLADRLAKETDKRVDASRLPLKNFSANTRVMRFEAFGERWEYQPKTGALSKVKAVFGHGGNRRGLRARAKSYDGKWLIEVKQHNIVLRALGDDGKPADGEPIVLTTDGTPTDSYTPRGYWSPDSSKFVVMKRKAGDTRHVTIVDTAPDDQLQPKTDSYFYLKPGDQVPVDRPILVDLETRKKTGLSTDLAENSYRIGDVRWKSDGSAFTYEYNQRGHQVYRVIEVDAETGQSRAVISEEPETFFTYSSKKFLHYLDDTGELIWMSERDGWNHLYLYDWETGKVKRQITQGEWVVREVDRVDRRRRQVWFWAGGIHEGQDPYHEHYCRVDIDTGQVVPVTKSDGTHTDVSVSPNGKYLVTTWSRIDHAPVHELRSAETGELVKELARADASPLTEAGWVAPERFAAKGRDGKTDIYGIIVKPTNFDPNKRYPVIENIYAGPHDAHVPKRFYEMMRTMRLAELGFIVVRIDGMGTNWRSKAFHDVAWKNLGDAGFPDRIAWMKAAAETRPWMDLERVGIYGGSAGGQNAMRAVLDHHDFYKAAAADCGCHDNRMDKIWWNEQWMGYPVDESYKKSSNLVDAHKLGGRLLLTVGELDRNVDPASTMQVVDALIKANKDFEFMVFTGKGHGAGESRYGVRLRNDFFVRHLHGKTPRQD
ncbi:MAG: prolyl oligopeptidase family serine peptidase [Phycisphaeraceae bacterium]|nr:prolyl oligopeptidase family serine peptidase [Phycisphaeraceae bacterium]